MNFMRIILTIFLLKKVEPQTTLPTGLTPPPTTSLPSGITPPPQTTLPLGLTFPPTTTLPSGLTLPFTTTFPFGISPTPTTQFSPTTLPNGLTLSPPAATTTSTTTTTTSKTTTTPTTTPKPSTSATAPLTQTGNSSQYASTTFPSFATTARPIRIFNVVLVARNKTFNLTRNELDESVANAIKNQLANQLNVTNTSIYNFGLTDGGSQVTIVKRSFVASPKSDSIISFSFTTDKYSTNEEVKNKLNPLNLTGYDFATENVYVSSDSDNCPTSQCSAGYSCMYKHTANHTYERTCLPVESATTSAPANQNNPKLLYLLFLLLLIPIVILIAVVAYCCWKQRDPDSRPFVNNYSIDRLQAPNDAFGSLSSEKSRIMIMGGDGPPMYETNPRRARGTVTSTHAFDNDNFRPDGSDRADVHVVPEGENSMTFSYMQMRNSKVNDDTMGLF